MLLSKYDLTLKNHLNQTIELSRKRLDKVGSSRGRGDLISFFLKTTLNYKIDSIRELIISRIADEVNEAKFFTIQIDTTQDINVTDQCSVIIRYVNDKVHERLIKLFSVSSSTGKSICDQVCVNLKLANINIKNCIGNATDGAANMQGQYNSFNTWLQEEAGTQLHT
ncbi:uncharacterized protein LOC112685602 [Sipha flava]|uniref:Uncharacterized protein LOC112685602 n=1 Tax=Sipha flava TaxID=143950 RepID=A0A8B8FSI7_9HEMI|nr:uncharacterized protein LOC112685602 [Sipha flava]